MSSPGILSEYCINEDNLRLRKEFIGLNSQDIKTLASLRRWAEKHSPIIAKAFYDHQFSFGPTMEFFNMQITRRGCTLDELRAALEKAQSEYLIQIFQEAEQNHPFGELYFERRLRVGQIHNKINLPPKWYIGSYPMYQKLVSNELKRTYLLRPDLRLRAERALSIIFNYDIQAISDAFMLDMMASAGFNLSAASVKPGSDITEYIGDIKKAFAQELKGVATALLTGDLTLEIHPCSENDSLRIALRESLLQLRSVTSDLSKGALELHKASGDIAEAIEDVAHAASQSSLTSNEIASGSEQQAQSATEAAGIMDTLHQNIKQVLASGQQQVLATRTADEGVRKAAIAMEEMSGSTRTMSATTGHAAEVAENGGQAVRETIAGMGRIQEIVNASEKTIRQLGDKGQEIGAIVETINQIAEQTNLLALNAAIEAARAGEHGRGFAVVADEVRKLAERSSHATREIAELIGAVRSGVDEAVSSMEKTGREVSHGAQQSNEAGNALKNILSAIQAVSENMNVMRKTAADMSAVMQEIIQTVSTVRLVAEENEAIMEEMTKGAGRVSGAVTAVAAVTEETAAGAQEMSATAAEVSSSAQKVSKTAASLQELASKLRNTVQHFRIEKDEKPKIKLAA